MRRPTACVLVHISVRIRNCICSPTACIGRQYHWLPHLTHPVAFIASFWLLPSFFNPGFLAAKPSTYISHE